MAGDDRGSWLRCQLAEMRWAIRLCVLPPKVAWFHLRAHRLASRRGDVFTLKSATRPADLRVLLGLAQGRSRVIELGTATGWTAISLALADPEREVVTYDIIAREQREEYLLLTSSHTRKRIEMVTAPGSSGPRDEYPVDLLYIDSSHDRDETIAEVLAWRSVLHPGALIVFDDFTHPDFPGVRDAIAELGLEGERQGTLYVHTVARNPSRGPR